MIRPCGFQDIESFQRTLQLALEILLRAKGALHVVQTESVNNINDLLGCLVECLLHFLGRRVGANVDVLAALGDFLAVDFVDDVVDLLEIPSVGDDFVTRDEILRDNCQLLKF